MRRPQFVRLAGLVLALAAMTAIHGSRGAPEAASAGLSVPIAPVLGPPGYAMQEPTTASPGAPVAAAPAVATYTHTPTPSPSELLPPGSGQVMTSTTLYYVFWLPTGQHFESNATGDTAYENLLIRWANDLGSSQFHNLVTQYNGTNGFITNNVTFGGSSVDMSAYPHAGSTADPLQDSDIRAEIASQVAANGWTEDVNHMVAVFTANGIQECASFGCTSDPGGFCAYHDHFSDSGHDTVYAFMGFDDFTHVAGYTCVAGQTGGDTDPNRGVYPNGDRAADAEVNTLSHEVIEAETDPHPNDTWTAPNPEGEIGDACNFNFAPRNDTGADVYLNGHPYIMQQELSNAAQTCAMDLPTNGFCAGSVSNVCAPSTDFAKSVDNAAPRVNSTIHYTLTLNNTNDTGAETNLSLSDTVPSGYVVTGLSAPSATSSSFTSSSISVGYDTLPVHQSRTVTVTATVPVQAGVAATNCGSLAGGDLIGTALSPQTSSPCATTTPVKIPTIVTYDGATSGNYHDAATVSATLTDASFNPLSSKPLTITLNGSESCSGTTDALGKVSCSITPHEAIGPYAISAAFTDSTDPVYDVSSTSSTFTVTREETTVAYTGPTVLLGGSSSATLKAHVVEDGTNDNDADGGSSPPSPGVSVTLSLGSDSCTATTDASGDASCPISVSSSLGAGTATAAVNADTHYAASSDSKSVIVFAFPSRGAFVLGNASVASATPTTSMTWWADTWSQLDQLTGGAAPASFKGFASSVSSLPTSSPVSSCGSTFSSSGGNSPPPTSGVPSYMGVLVASSVTKSGSTINGKWAHIVVVKTDSGYAPDPASHGTGVIVGTFC